MTRIRFENLPSTNTPRNAENLNKLNNVVISSTEPTTGEEVWLEKGKNLFNGILRNVAISSTTGEETISATTKSSEYINVNSSTNYTMSTNEIEHKYYYYYYNENKQFISTGSSGYDINNHTFTTPQNCKYIKFSLSSPTSTQIQIEQGNATSYEAYVDKKIYTKNNNGVYEEFTNNDIAESGSNSNGNYVKYSDGTMICYNSLEITSTGSWSELGSLYRLTFTNPVTFPQTFLNLPSLTITPCSNIDFTYCMIYAAIQSTSNITRIDVVRANAGSNTKTRISYIAIGKWK